jgi:hypothetical protein
MIKSECINKNSALKGIITQALDTNNAIDKVIGFSNSIACCLNLTVKQYKLLKTQENELKNCVSLSIDVKKDKYSALILNTSTTQLKEIMNHIKASANGIEKEVDFYYRNSKKSNQLAMA